MERINKPYGVDLKYKIDITQLGDEMSLDNVGFKITFKSGGESKSYTVASGTAAASSPRGLTKVNDHEVIAACPTGDLERGELFLTVSADVSDSDFEDGTRHEEKTIDLGINII